MKVYTVNTDYCKYLQYYESKIPFVRNEKENRPFISLFCINSLNFFAPLMSPQIKHITMKNSQDFFKIDNGKLGAINFNNIIPIPQNCLKEIDIDKIIDLKYKRMLLMQMDWIEKKTKKE